MKRIFAIVSCVLFLTLTSPLSHAQLYKWVDAQGKIHYGDSPPENADLKNINGDINSFGSVNVEPFEFDPQLVTASTASKSVVMYTTSWCGYCRSAAKYFRQKNIPFTEYDVEKSDKGARDYRRLKGRGVPIILIGRQRMNGFDVNRFNQIYYGS
jgi:glutaredoxin